MNRHRLIKFFTLFAFVIAFSCDSLLLAASRFGLRFSKRSRVFKMIAWTLDSRTTRPSVTMSVTHGLMEAGTRKAGIANKNLQLQ